MEGCLIAYSDLKFVRKNVIDRLNHQVRCCRQASIYTPKRNVGFCFDIDGVVARGYIPFDESKKAFSLLQKNGNLQYPVTFVTNGMALHGPKANQLSSWVKAEVSPDQCVLCQSPLQCYDDFKTKHCLVIGQGPLREIAAELGFNKVSLIEDVADAYTMLDVVHLDKKEKLHSIENYVDPDFPQVEAIIILGEPGNWETPLQLIIDLLLTYGQPVKGAERMHRQTLPIIACNKDFQYMHRAHIPRFGNGAFLLCLETIFQKLIGQELNYSALIGKPSETTLRFAEHRLSQQAAKLGITQPLQTLYMIGDNTNSDITAANLYQRFITNQKDATSGTLTPLSRQLPSSHPLLPQTVEKVHGILVKTGVYSDEQKTEVDHSHKDFRFDQLKELEKPTVIVDNILHAVEYILEREHTETRQETSD